MDSCIPQSIIQFFFHIVHRSRCSLLEKILCIVHISKNFSKSALVFEFGFAHLHEIHEGSDMRPQISDWTFLFMLMIEKTHEYCISLYSMPDNRFRNSALIIVLYYR